ncbi:type I-F CRISPR-associated protein Csy2 [Pantoea sp. 18069]|uniref:type I-F CRISPR-associated protein Csy2 n=1 Tax=Pantoea sp. 18069 TaxID=2681415 RepID=UPI00135CB2FE|nr:type I-F CRISPR-associated protein Csy2 [Pantoea sp. 18069]
MSADLHSTFDRALLLVPHLQVQNANAISSPMTWGFPSITAFVGLMAALERKLGADCGLQFNGVGVVCHRFEAQTHRGYTHSFHLSRNPVRKDGSTAGIVEEGRIHLDISLVFDVGLSSQLIDEAARQQLAQTVADLLATMRIAGGSVIASHTPRSRRALQPQLRLEAQEPGQQRKEFAQLSRRLLPGFALVARDDLLQAHQRTLSQRQTKGHADPSTPATALDAWLDLSRINTRAMRVPVPSETPVPDAADAKPAAAERIEWQRDLRPGWLAPIPVGYAALSTLHPAGSVVQARDATTPLRFVESVFSIGQWISPHRLRDARQLIWWPTYDEATGLYRCRNACEPETFTGSTAALAAEQPPANPSETVSA